MFEMHLRNNTDNITKITVNLILIQTIFIYYLKALLFFNKYISQKQFLLLLKINYYPCIRKAERVYVISYIIGYNFFISMYNSVKSTGSNDFYFELDGGHEIELI